MFGKWKKKTKKKSAEEVRAEDFVITTLKKKFLSLAAQEKFPKTPEITEELDYIIKTIKELQAENDENLEQDA